MKKKTVFVISGGPIGNLTCLRSRLDVFAPVEIVCADSGARHLDALGLTPQVIVGDMDSIAPDLLERFRKQGSRIIPYPADKEKTDTWLALEYALDMKPEQVIIFGALGGRIDHALANISLLALTAERGITARIIDEWCEMFVITGEAAIDGEKGQTLSLLPLTTEVTGISLTGFQYPLDSGTMEIGKPYGISNRLVSERGTVSVASGLLLAIRYFRAGTFPEGV